MSDFQWSGEQDVTLYLFTGSDSSTLSYPRIECVSEFVVNLYLTELDVGNIHVSEKKAKDFWKKSWDK